MSLSKQAYIDEYEEVTFNWKEYRAKILLLKALIEEDKRNEALDFINDLLYDTGGLDE